MPTASTALWLSKSYSKKLIFGRFCLLKIINDLLSVRFKLGWNFTRYKKGDFCSFPFLFFTFYLLGESWKNSGRLQ